MRSICGQQLLRCLRAHQRSSDQMNILKDQSAKTISQVLYNENVHYKNVLAEKKLKLSFLLAYNFCKNDLFCLIPSILY